MAKVLDTEDVIEMLRKRQGPRTNTDMAKEFGIGKAYYGDIMMGRRAPGPAILTKLGLKRVFVLEKAS